MAYYVEARYKEEAERHANLNQLLEEGHAHAAMLYTWRCSSRYSVLSTQTYVYKLYYNLIISRTYDLICNKNRFCRALPVVKGNNDPNREEIHTKTDELLGPEIKQLYRMIEFVKSAVNRFSDEIKKLSLIHKTNGSINNIFLY